MAYGFILPTLILFGIFVVWPLIQTVYLSFNNWNGIGAIEFAGLSNYVEFFTDPHVLQSVAEVDLIFLINVKSQLLYSVQKNQPLFADSKKRLI